MVAMGSGPLVGLIEMENKPALRKRLTIRSGWKLGRECGMVGATQYGSPA
jgi:hypothetical protein